VSETVDCLITGAAILPLEGAHGLIEDGALAIRGTRIAAVGPRAELEPRLRAARRIDGRGCLLTPGLVDAHIHVTGDPLTRGHVPGHLAAGFEETLERWVLPRYLAHTEADEHLSAQLAAVEMLRSGTTCFLEAGTVRFLDAVVAGLESTGIRGRVGRWIEGRSQERGAGERAIRELEDQVARYPVREDARIAAWPVLIGHNTNPDEVWQAAKAIADARGLGVAAHMSPYAADPQWFLEHCGRRPVEHLAEIGVLGSNLALTHMVHIDEHEQRLLAEAGASVVHCPFAALKGAFGVGRRGRFPEMAQAGINIALGTDGYASDLLAKTGLCAALFKDAREDRALFPAREVLAMATANGARVLGMAGAIGVLRPGARADIVMHELDRPEWRPVLNPLEQLVFSADGRSVHSVWVDGERVVEGYHCTRVDEQALYAAAQAAGEAICRRSGVPPPPGQA